MNTQTQKALKMAIEALAKCKEAYLAGPNWQKVGYDILDKSQQACKEALAQPAQEPVAWIEVTTHHEKYQTSKVILLDKGIKLPHDTPLYTHPAPPCQECENLKHDLEGYMDANKALINREWQGLSDDDKKKLHKEHHLYIPTIEKIESMLKKKNYA